MNCYTFINFQLQYTRWLSRHGILISRSSCINLVIVCKYYVDKSVTCTCTLTVTLFTIYYLTGDNNFIKLYSNMY